MLWCRSCSRGRRVRLLRRAPAAVKFLQNFNDENYDILLQARDYYRFAIMVLIAMGLLFQLPDRDPRRHADGDRHRRAQLRKNRRYAMLVIAVIASCCPARTR